VRVFGRMLLMVRSVLYVLLIFLGLYGCAPVTPTSLPKYTGPPRPCSEIQATELRALLISQASPEEIRVRIAALSDLPIKKVEASGSAYSWSANGIEGLYIVQNPDTPSDFQSVSFRFTERLPSMERVLECLGAPDSYGAWYYGTPDGYPILSFRLFYEQEGIAVLSSQTGNFGQPPPLDVSTLAEDFYYVHPNSPHALSEGLAFGISEERQAKIKPWPGSWDKIEIDTEPAAR
jgi:hypothetical protein